MSLYEKQHNGFHSPLYYGIIWSKYVNPLIYKRICRAFASRYVCNHRHLVRLGRSHKPESNLYLASILPYLHACLKVKINLKNIVHSWDLEQCRLALVSLEDMRFNQCLQLFPCTGTCLFHKPWIRSLPAGVGGLRCTVGCWRVFFVTHTVSVKFLFVFPFRW